LQEAIHTTILKMIIYNVTTSIDKEVHDDWLVWMKTVHIPDVMNTGLFLENKMCRVLVEEDAGITYSVQYTAATMEDVQTYQREHGPRLQKEFSNRYANKYVLFRTLLEVV
jgi:hypothetical protein